MKYYCFGCEVSYAHGSETRTVGHGAATRHFCPKCGEHVRSCMGMMRAGIKLPAIWTASCSKCYWRFRCYTNGWGTQIGQIGNVN
jgi:hypothetical protein